MRLKPLKHASSARHSKVLEDDVCRASEDARHALADYKRARRTAGGVGVKAIKLSAQFEDMADYVVGLKEDAETAREAATKARVTFEGVNGAWTAAKLASIARKKNVHDAKLYHEALIAESKKAADQVAEESFWNLTRGLDNFTTLLEMAATSRDNMKKHVPSLLAADPTFQTFLDRSVHNTDLLQPDDRLLADLSPYDVADVREEGMAIADAMWADTALAVEEGKANMGPGVRTYVPSLVEAESLAAHEEMVVREAVRLAALGKRRFARQLASAATYNAAERAGRDLDEAKAALASSEVAESVAAEEAAAALVDLSRAQTEETASDRVFQEIAANVQSLQQEQATVAVELERVEAAVRPVEARLVQARSAKRRAELEYSKYRPELLRE